MPGPVYVFVFAMWLLILLGGALIVTVLGPFSFGGFVGLDPMLNSGIKVAIALTLVSVWILILSAIKNWMFKKQIKS
ncbi:MAG: hypothetical protein FJ360_03000 [Thaumarchaeota archaeon]|nr:hypothetical protein [Nitrososphaerota archaeon]